VSIGRIDRHTCQLSGRSRVRQLSSPSKGETFVGLSASPVASG
jgi:hypothetical protein